MRFSWPTVMIARRTQGQVLWALHFSAGVLLTGDLKSEAVSETMNVIMLGRILSQKHKVGWGLGFPVENIRHDILKSLARDITLA